MGRQLKLRNTSSSIVLPYAEEEARIWKLSRRREDREILVNIFGTFKLLGVSITENMIWHEHVSSIATAGKKLGYLFRARKYFSPSNLLTPFKAQIRPSLEYCSHIWGVAAPLTLSILDAVQRKAIRLIDDLTCHLQPLSHRRAVGDLSLFNRYSNGFCSSELTSIFLPLTKPGR
nr:unnamed protein product [Callosobruchus chinensis]